MTAKRKKKTNKGFKFTDLVYSFSSNFIIKKCENAGKYSFKKSDKPAKTPPENIVGEYCPKETGCCWDYMKKKEGKENVA